MFLSKNKYANKIAVQLTETLCNCSRFINISWTQIKFQLQYKYFHERQNERCLFSPGFVLTVRFPGTSGGACLQWKVLLQVEHSLFCKDSRFFPSSEIMCIFPCYQFPQNLEQLVSRFISHRAQTDTDIKYTQRGVIDFLGYRQNQQHKKPIQCCSQTLPSLVAMRAPQLGSHCPLSQGWPSQPLRSPSPGQGSCTSRWCTSASHCACSSAFHCMFLSAMNAAYLCCT